MRTILIILVIFYNFSVLSQIKDTIYKKDGDFTTEFKNSFNANYNIEKYKWLVNYFEKSDTVYVFFDYEKHQYIDSLVVKLLKPNKNNHYMFDNYKKFVFKLDANNFIDFTYNDYSDFDSFDKNLKTDVQKVKKTFIKNHKNQIINIGFFLKNGFKETFLAIYKKKIYIIDSHEIKYWKVILREVNISSPYIGE